MALSKTLFVAAVFLQSGDEPRAGHELVREQPRAVRLAQHKPQKGAAEGGWHCELRFELKTRVHEVFTITEMAPTLRIFANKISRPL